MTRGGEAPARLERPGHGRRAAILATSLLLAVLLLILGIAFLTVVERDVHFQAHSEQQSRAYFLARSGIELYFYEIQLVGQSGGVSSIAAGSTNVYTLDGTSSFNITQLPSDTCPGTGCLVQGVVQNSAGQIVGLRTLIMPDRNNIGSTYEPNY